jgi:hypothetical protein
MTAVTSSRWFVQLQGHPFDLGHLALHLLGPDLTVCRDERGSDHLLYSSSFTDDLSSEQIAERANQFAVLLSGALTVIRTGSEPVRVGAVYRTNDAGGRDVFVRLNESISVRAEVGAVVVSATDSEGVPVAVTQPPSRTQQLIQLAAADPAIAKVLRLVVGYDAKLWVGLYRIYEVIEADVGGQSALVATAWGSESDLRRFKHSANSVAAAGDAARHGREVTQPPRNPMTLPEGEAYVSYAVLRSQLAFGKRPATTILTARAGLVQRQPALSFQRCGSSSSTRLAG